MHIVKSPSNCPTLRVSSFLSAHQSAKSGHSIPHLRGVGLIVASRSVLNAAADFDLSLVIVEAMLRESTDLYNEPPAGCLPLTLEFRRDFRDHARNDGVWARLGVWIVLLEASCTWRWCEPTTCRPSQQARTLSRPSKDWSGSSPSSRLTMSKSSATGAPLYVPL